MDGDTIIASEDGIVEVNWLYSKYIKWNDVLKVCFYSSKKMMVGIGWKTVESNWVNIKISGKNQSIRVNTKYSNNERLQQYITKQCAGKITEGSFEPLVMTIALIAASTAILGLIYLPEIREYLESILNINLMKP